MKTTRSFDELISKTLRTDDNKVVGCDGGRTNKMVINSSGKLMRVPNIGAIGESIFLTPNAKKTFNHLWLAFIKAPIVQYFDLENHIQIEDDASGYAIGGMSS